MVLLMHYELNSDLKMYEVFCVFFLILHARKRQLKRHQPSGSQESRESNLPGVSREEAYCESYHELREMRRSEIYETVQ